ncbi:maltokinase N-terminal cap-like domain-containing protein [Actinomadura bangladeshensis]|uniref:1,4-alpha-glucan branching protein n=1 Tax=Actinomadura bangladeshensis TaxID=453573 RepID=A0A6L9QGM2_9ACTN|nr:1,4-alpha-glucan branching protein [Actinomadura bangladeshensis]NEA23264.1 1,4-alpha-glucan branching protein [Actinomadura bangladeshensis]
MAVIHKTTMTPGKLELLAAWLPDRPWYTGTGREPELAKAGGFRLDDPAGEVGIEFMVVTDTSGERPVSYQVPLTYRGVPLDGADEALIGTAEHGVLGRRWVYDGAHDPVLVAQLLALVQGRAEAQHQSKSDAPEPSVSTHYAGSDLPAMAAITAVEEGREGTGIVVATEAGGTLTVAVSRVLRPIEDEGGGAEGRVTAVWQPPGGTVARASFAVLRTSH